LPRGAAGAGAGEGAEAPGGGGGGGGGALPGARFVAAHAGALLEACRAASASGAWRAAGAAPVRHVVSWVLARLPVGGAGAHLAAALPLALRLCDDWEATAVWCGLSALAAALRAATPAALAPWGGLVREALARAAAAARHPTLAAAHAHAAACALASLHGAPPAVDAAPLARALRGGGGGGGGGESGGYARAPPLFDGPWDAAVTALLRDAALAASGAALRAHVDALPPLLLALGPGAARHVTAVLPLLARAVHAGGDARTLAVALHALRAAAAASPRCFGAGADAAPPLAHEALALCLRAALAAGAGLCSLPAPPREAGGGGEGGGGGGGRGP